MDEDCLEAFMALKEKLSMTPILVYPSTNEDFIVCTDASNTAIGAVLEQKWKVIAYASRVLSKSEINYSTNEL